MQNPQDVQRVAEILRQRLPEIVPQTGIVLGTGLGNPASVLTGSVRVAYRDLPGYPLSTVDGHEGYFIFGHLGAVPVILQQGRCHLYEGYSPREVCMGVRVMAALGIRDLILTNAAGALNPQFETGTLMLITDHINMTGVSPLTGPNCDAWGPRYPDMSEVYDKRLLALAMECARREGIRVERGVYLCTPGPQMETPAETRFYRQIGADAIGMSTVPESIAARHLGLRLLGISCLTNKNLPDCMAPASIQEIVATARAAGEPLARLLSAVVQGCTSDGGREGNGERI